MNNSKRDNYFKYFIKAILISNFFLFFFNLYKYIYIFIYLYMYINIYLFLFFFKENKF